MSMDRETKWDNNKKEIVFKKDKNSPLKSYEEREIFIKKQM
jgi:hypothetical protein